MKKNAIFMVMLGWLALTLMGGVVTYLKVNVRGAPIRSQPRKNSQLLGRLKYGTLLEVLKRRGRWYYIKEKSGTLKGYVHSNFVIEVGTSAHKIMKQPATREKRMLKTPAPRPSLPKYTPQKPNQSPDLQPAAAFKKIIQWNGYTFYLQAENADSYNEEAKIVDLLKRLITEFNVEPWVRVRDINIKKRGISQSNPFTINTRHIKDRQMLLATFLHEQIHRLEPEHKTEFTRAMQEIENEFHDLLSDNTGDATDRLAAKRHFIVCYFEIKAVKKLLGTGTGLAVIGRKDKNVWIYQQLLIPAKAAIVRDICLNHRLNPEYH